MKAWVEFAWDKPHIKAIVHYLSEGPMDPRDQVRLQLLRLQLTRDPKEVPSPEIVREASRLDRLDRLMKRIATLRL